MRKKRPSLKQDENERAYALVQAMTGEGSRPEPPGKREKNPEAQARGRKGGKIGGKARAAKLTPAKRRKIAKKASQARWSRSEASPE